MDATTAPPADQERIVCSIAAAAKYQLPAHLLLAIAEKEGGRPGLYVKNTNGTSDIGTLQFNSAYLATLRRYAITETAVAAPGCYPYQLAAWRLRQHIRNDKGDLWTRAANFHSRTPAFNGPYRRDLIAKANRWATWLAGSTPATVEFPASALANDQYRGSDVRPDAEKSFRRPSEKSTKYQYVPRTVSVSTPG